MAGTPPAGTNGKATLERSSFDPAPESDPGSRAPIRFPAKVACDAAGRLFAADTGQHRVLVARLGR